MKNFIETLSRETLIASIREAFKYFLQNKEATLTISDLTLKIEIVSSAYIFLKQFNLYKEEIQLFKDILAEEDIESLKNINSYNYHQIKMKR